MKHPRLVEVQDKLKTYRELLERYHKTLDLMSSKALTSLDTKLLEAQQYSDFIAPRLSPTDRILDLGSGAGLPGIPLALTFPENLVTLVERRQRRGSFLKIVASQLQLENAEVVIGDVRDFKGEPYRWVTAQAVGSFPLIYCLTNHLHAPSVTLLTRRSELSPAEETDLECLSGPTQSVKSVPMPTHGKLVGVQVQGGQPCPSSG